MATSSFMKEFSVNKKNAARYAEAIKNSRNVTFQQNNKVVCVKRENISSFLTGVKK